MSISRVLLQVRVFLSFIFRNWEDARVMVSSVSILVPPGLTECAKVYVDSAAYAFEGKLMQPGHCQESGRRE